MMLKERYAVAMEYFQAHIPFTETELHYHTSFELLVAVVLSAQCTDKRVNMVTPALFADYPTPQAMAEATPEQIFPYISSISYPNNKARHLCGLARMLVKDFGGDVPSCMEDLVKLPGVGRKTANVILAIIFHQSALAVDTHVFRVSHRLGLVSASCTTPYSVEVALRRYIPDSQTIAAHFWLLHHGRYVCTSRAPHCVACGLQKICKYYVQVSKTQKNAGSR